MSLKYHVSVDPTAANESRAKLARLAGAGSRVLDLGCHAGDLARVLKERGCRVWGVEVDPEAAALAVPHCEDVIIADLDRLDLPAQFGPGAFDVVIMADVIEHLADPRHALRMARAVLHPAGRLLLSVPNVAHVSVRMALLAGDFTYTDIGILDRTHRWFFTRASLDDLLAQEGFAADLWDPVVQPWSETRLREELERAGLSAAPDLIARLSQDDAAAFQYVVRASGLDAEKPALSVVIIAPGPAVNWDRIREWKQCAPGHARTAAVVPEAAQGPAAAPEQVPEVTVIPFGTKRAFGAALAAALPRPLAGRIVALHADLSPDPALIAELAATPAGAAPETPAVVAAQVETQGPAWWNNSARLSSRERDLNLEFFSALNLGLPAALLAQTPFPDDFPFPWAFVEWWRRCLKRGAPLLSAGTAARPAVARGQDEMSAFYRRCGARLQELAGAYPAFVNRCLPADPGPWRRAKHLVRGLGYRFFRQPERDSFVKHLRAIALADGFREAGKER